MVEYKRIAEIVGPGNLILTNFRHPIPEEWPDVIRRDIRVFPERLVDLEQFERGNICLLDSESTELLQPEDSRLFDYFLFGGILGNGKQPHPACPGISYPVQS